MDQIPYKEKFIVLDRIAVEDTYCTPLTLDKDTVLLFIYTTEDRPGKRIWVFQEESDEYEDTQIVITEDVLKTSLETYSAHYQKKFSRLDPSKSYFGQLRTNASFSLTEGNNRDFYLKIDDYINSEGVVINAYKLLDSSDTYWRIDDQETYSNKEFLHFDLDQPIVCNSWLRTNEFNMPKVASVNEYFVDFPEMLDVVESLFKKEQLTPELQKVYDNYDEFRRDRAEYDEPCYYAITSIPALIKEKDERMERERIMGEIEAEVRKFRSKLMNERLKL